MSAEHTPTKRPWYADKDGYIRCDDGNAVALTFTFGTDRWPGTNIHHEPNAALIVTAVNSWNDLSALKARVAELERGEG